MLAKPVILHTKRGLRISGREKCKQCSRNLATWRYAESNYGVVYLCTPCKPNVFKRSFGRIDAIDSAFRMQGMLS